MLDDDDADPPGDTGGDEAEELTLTQLNPITCSWVFISYFID